MTPDSSVLKSIPVTNTTIRVGDILTIGSRYMPVIELQNGPNGCKVIHLPERLVLSMPPNLELTIARRVPVTTIPETR